MDAVCPKSDDLLLNNAYIAIQNFNLKIIWKIKILFFKTTPNFPVSNTHSSKYHVLNSIVFYKSIFLLNITANTTYPIIIIIGHYLMHPQFKILSSVVPFSDILTNLTSIKYCLVCTCCTFSLTRIQIYGKRGFVSIMAITNLNHKFLWYYIKVPPMDT